MLTLLACSSTPPDSSAPGLVRVVDTHAHIASGADYPAAAAAALESATEQGFDVLVLLPTPLPDAWDHAYTAEDLRGAVEVDPERLRLVAGGGTLNPAIQRAVAGEAVDVDAFQAEAEALLDAGAVGFGELAAEHLILGGTEPYVHAPPDHELFLRLAEVAAARGVPIDFHMEAVPEDMATPPWLLAQEQNPTTLSENLSGFARLLEHADAPIVWAHAGWGPLGLRTPALCESMLEAHPNLHMSLKATGEGSLSVLVVDGELDPDWLALIERYPDRFLLGSDHFHLSPGQDVTLPAGGEPTGGLVELLPEHLRGPVAWDNAARLYGLD